MPIAPSRTRLLEGRSDNAQARSRHNGHRAADVLMFSCSVSHAGQSEALIDAATRGDLKQIQHLLDRGADVNVKTENADGVDACGQRGHLEIVRLLLQKGADVNAKNRDGPHPENRCPPGAQIW